MSKWQPIETAPRDGTPVILCSDRTVAIGSWNPEGDSWVDENGDIEGPAHHLEVTGFWNSSGGWFQPNEVSHWMPLPAPPSLQTDQSAS